MFKLQNYLNGELVAPNSNEYLDNFNPSTGKVYSLIPDSDASDVKGAVKAAKAAYPAWSVTPKEKRSAIMLKIVELINKNYDKLAEAESTDNGKPLWLAKKVDIARAASNFEFFATVLKDQGQAAS